jgi:hypothetical protein
MRRTRSQTFSEQRWNKEQRLRVGVGWQANLPEKLNYHQAEVWWGTKAESKGGVTSQPPKARVWSLKYSHRTEEGIQNWTAPTCWERSWGRSCSGRATQLPPDKNSNRSALLGQTGSDLPLVPILTCPVDRRNQILLKAGIWWEDFRATACNGQPMRPTKRGK